MHSETVKNETYTIVFIHIIQSFTKATVQVVLRPVMLVKADFLINNIKMEREVLNHLFSARKHIYLCLQKVYKKYES